MEGRVEGEGTAVVGTGDVAVVGGTAAGGGGADSGVPVGRIWSRRWRCGCGAVTAGGGGSMSTGSGGIRVGVVLGVVSDGVIFTHQRRAPPFSRVPWMMGLPAGIKVGCAARVAQLAQAEQVAGE